jgi:hypothetical protein
VREYKKGDGMNYRLSTLLCSILLVGMIMGTEECSKKQCPEMHRTLPHSKGCAVRCSTACFDCGVTTFIPRSTGANTARELVGWQSHLYKPYLIENYAALAFTGEYTRSFNHCDLARILFCTDCLTFAGSQATPRTNGTEIIADYFGLPTNFRGTLAIRPFIENYIVDINCYFGLDEILPGLYLRLHAPITHTRWSLGLDECLPCADKFRGSDTFPTCYMFSDSTVTNPNPNPECVIHDALHPLIPFNENCTTQSIRTALSGDFTFGDMQERWNFGRFDFCPRTKTGLADLDVILGLNLLQSDWAHFAIYTQFVIPTGDTPRAKFIFEPIVGNGGHPAFGAGISAHASLFSDHSRGGRNVGFYIEGNVVHFFKHDQRRSFDFKNNGLLSRYILLKEYDINNKYLGRLINAINFATRNADVRIHYQADVTFKIAMGIGRWGLDLGYNIYARGKEEVCIKTECPCDIDLRRFAIKGTEGVCCINFAIENGMVVPPSTGQKPVNASQPNATMFTVEPPQQISIAPDAENVCLAFNSKQVTTPTPVSDITVNNGFVVTDGTPVIISCNDLDPNSAAQCSMFTHKLFTHISYMWYDYCYSPHVGIGAEIEFAGKKIHNALTQWGVWIKGGITF